MFENCPLHNQGLFNMFEACSERVFYNHPVYKTKNEEVPNTNKAF